MDSTVKWYAICVITFLIILFASLCIEHVSDNQVEIAKLQSCALVTPDAR